MKTLIIYKSIHQGNTKKIAEAMAEAVDADLAEPHEVDANNIREYDIVGFGSGIYWWKHHIELLQLVDGLPQMKKKAFIFSTRGAGSVSLCHRALKKKLEAKGFEIKGEFSRRCYETAGPLKLLGGINKGRPNQQDIEDAQKFARSLESKH